MSEINGENSRVSYSVKELLGRIDRKLESIDLKMDMKADIKDVDALSSRVEAQGQRMAAIEQRIGRAEQVAEERNRSEGLNISRRVLAVALFAVFASPTISFLLSGGFHP